MFSLILIYWCYIPKKKRNSKQTSITQLSLAGIAVFIFSFIFQVINEWKGRFPNNKNIKYSCFCIFPIQFSQQVSIQIVYTSRYDKKSQRNKTAAQPRQLMWHRNPISKWSNFLVLQRNRSSRNSEKPMV